MPSEREHEHERLQPRFGAEREKKSGFCVTDPGDDGMDGQGHGQGQGQRVFWPPLPWTPRSSGNGRGKESGQGRAGHARRLKASAATERRAESTGEY